MDEWIVTTLATELLKSLITLADSDTWGNVLDDFIEHEAKLEQDPDLPASFELRDLEAAVREAAQCVCNVARQYGTSLPALIELAASET